MIVKQLSFEVTEAKGDDKRAARVAPEEGATTCSACGKQNHGASMCPLKVEVIKSSGVKLGPTILKTRGGESMSQERHRRCECSQRRELIDIC